MTIYCFKRQFSMLMVLIFLIVPLSCSTTKEIEGMEKHRPVDAQSPKEEPKSVEVKTKDQQTVNTPEKDPLKITVNEAVLIAMENNRSLMVERMNPEIRKTYEDQERALFDPTIEMEFSAERDDSMSLGRTGKYTVDTEQDVYQGGLSIKEFFPTGTFVEVGDVSRTTDSSQYDQTYSSSRVGLSITQSLLRGFGTDANLAKLRQARIETDISQYELRGFSELLLAQVETAYWDYALSLRQIEIVEESLKLANQHIEETREMVRVGTMAESELVAAQAELATEQQRLIDAKSKMESNRVQLIRLLNPPGRNRWYRDVIPVYQPTLPEVKFEEVETHITLALRMRPDMNQAKLGIQKDDLEIVRTKNGLLPRMDLFITLGKTGYSESFSDSMRELSGDNYDAMVGLNFEYPIVNRDAGAEHRRALLSRNQAELALDNLERLVEMDVRNAYIEVNRAKKQISASTATRKFQEEKLRIETEKFRVGLSTNFFVSQAQRDLMASRISEVEAVVSYLKALIDFYRLEGTLLERRGIDAPGSNPVE